MRTRVTTMSSDHASHLGSHLESETSVTPRLLECQQRNFDVILTLDFWTDPMRTGRPSTQSSSVARAEARDHTEWPPRAPTIHRTSSTMTKLTRLLPAMAIRLFRNLLEAVSWSAVQAERMTVDGCS